MNWLSARLMRQLDLYWNYRSCEIFKKLDFDCYLMAKENNTIAMGTQKISAVWLLCFTILVMTVTREPHAQQDRMLMENKTRSCCQEWDGSRWKNLPYMTVLDNLGPQYDCWGITLHQQKGNLLHAIIFQIEWKHRRMGELNFTLQKSNWN